MPKTKYVKFPFTALRIKLAQQLLQESLAYMASKKSTATDPAEVAFYEKQSVQFQALVDLLGEGGAAPTIRLTEEQFRILVGGVKHRNLQEMRAINALPTGAGREQRLAACDEWETFANDLEAKDPRKFDTSQDAEAEDDDVEGDEAN